MELFEVLDLFDQWRSLTHNGLNASIQGVSLLWKEAEKNQQLPSSSAIDAVVKEVGKNHWMLDPENQESAAGEEHESGRDWKRLQVINTGIRSAAQLAEHNSADDLEPVRTALQKIIDSELNSFGSRVRHGIRLNAEDALRAMQAPDHKAAAL